MVLQDLRFGCDLYVLMSLLWVFLWMSCIDSLGVLGCCFWLFMGLSVSGDW